MWLTVGGGFSVPERFANPREAFRPTGHHD